MNWKQKMFLWLGITAIVAMGLYPPYVLIYNINGIPNRVNAGYSWIHAPKDVLGFDPIYRGMIPVGSQIQIESGEPRGLPYDLSKQHYGIPDLNLPQLCIQWFIVAVITAGLIATFRGKRDT